MQVSSLIMTPSPSFVLDTIYVFKGNNRYDEQELSLGVIIPARDEEKNIKNCIDAIESQTYKPSKIVAIDDGSKDRTGDILASYDARLKLIRHEKPKGKAQSIMEALDELDTDLVVIVDADTMPACDNFEKLRLPFSDKKVGAVCSTVFSLHNSKESLAEKFIRSGRLDEYLLSIYRKRGQSNRLATYVASGCTVAFRRDLLKKYGIPLRTETEDLDLTWLLQEEGYDVIYQPDAISYTREPRSLRGLKRQIGRWFRGAWQCAFLHGTYPLKSKRKRLVSTTWLQLAEGIPLSTLWLSLPVLSVARVKFGPITFTPEWALAYYSIDFASSALPILYYAKKHEKFWQAVKSFPSWYGIRTAYAVGLLYGFSRTLMDWAKGIRSWKSKWERVQEYNKNTHKFATNGGMRVSELESRFFELMNIKSGNYTCKGQLKQFAERLMKEIGPADLVWSTDQKHLAEGIIKAYVKNSSKERLGVYKNNLKRMLKTYKKRFGDDGLEKSLKVLLEKGSLELYKPKSGCRSSSIEKRNKIIELVRRGYHTVRELANETGCSYASVYYHVRVLEEEGYLKRKKKGRRLRISPKLSLGEKLKNYLKLDRLN